GSTPGAGGDGPRVHSAARGGPLTAPQALGQARMRLRPTAVREASLDALTRRLLRMMRSAQGLQVIHTVVVPADDVVDLVSADLAQRSVRPHELTAIAVATKHADTQARPVTRQARLAVRVPCHLVVVLSPGNDSAPPAQQREERHAGAGRAQPAPY